MKTLFAIAAFAIIGVATASATTTTAKPVKKPVPMVPVNKGDQPV